jgi:hypothetical protein
MVNWKSLRANIHAVWVTFRRYAVKAWSHVISILKWNVPHYERGGLYSQSVFVVGCWAFWELWPPIIGRGIEPGFAIGALALAAVIMTVRANQLSKWEKVIWIITGFMLFVGEVHVIDQDHLARDKQHRDEMARQEQQFGKTMAAAEKTLNETNHAAQSAAESVDNITGGNSYVVVAPVLVPIGEPNAFKLFAFLGKNGKNRTLQDVSIQVRKLPIPNEGTKSGLMNVLTASDGVVFRGTVMSRTAQRIGQITPDSVGETDYVVNTVLRNKQTVETLKVRRSQDGEWEYSYTIGEDTMRGTPNHPSTLKMLEKTDPTWRRTKPLVKP